MVNRQILGALLLAGSGLAAVSPASLKSDISILIHNDLLEDGSPNANTGVLLLDPMTLNEAQASCEQLGEGLWGAPLTPSDIQTDLEYLLYQGKYGPGQQFWISPANKGRTTNTIDIHGTIRKGANAKQHLPALCTQSAPYSNANHQNTSAQYQVTVHANNEDLTGFRDRQNFRFLGIRYAEQPERFTYSKLYTGSGSQSALEFGSECLQGTTGAEDCLFLNVWTPYLPSVPLMEKKNLKPVAFWIHGGAFTSGTGSDPTFDGGNMASRGDVVVVSINYRLGNLGFLALNDGKTNGNYGLADQIIALDWVRQNIEAFGGDPDRVTIFGQSAGAGSVRALLATPQARGKFVAGIMQSNLGGLAYGTTYSLYYTIEEEMEVAGSAILEETNCTTAPSPVDCLRALPATIIQNLAATARYLVVDGTYLTSTELQLQHSGDAAFVPLLIGTMRDDGAAFIGYPQVGENLTSFLPANGLPEVSASLFPLATGPNATLNVFNTTARVATDGIFRCADEATAFAGLTNNIFPSIHYYEFNRAYQLLNWSPNRPVCEAPVTEEYPYGDPEMEYFKCHSGDLYFVFGNVLRMGYPLRDAYDLPFEQFVLDSWASFVRTADPVPDLAFLEARGYTNTTQEVKEGGAWPPLKHNDLSMRRLQWPSEQVPLSELQQCTSLNVSLNYYL